MSKFKVAIGRYETPLESTRKVIDLCGGLDQMPSGAKVVIKPNIVSWATGVPFPKWGMITTSRVMQDVVELLAERGIKDMMIVEGPVMFDVKDLSAPHDAFDYMGYRELEKRYGVKCHVIFERKFRKVDLGDGVVLNMNTDILDADFVVNVPVMKTHAQTVVSFGIKNLKGTIDIPSRRACHNADPDKDLNFWIARLADPMPPMLTLVDGIYTNERGPSYDGKARRSNLLAASTDVLSVDLVCTRILGHDPKDVPHLNYAAKNRGRGVDMADVEVVGEKIEDVASTHEYLFPYVNNGTLPGPMAKMGVQGLSYRKYDNTMCTYCSGVNGAVLTAIAMAWKGEPWDDVEILTGKAMEPDPNAKHTILLGKCLSQKHKNNPNIKHMIPIKGCPPKPEQIINALKEAGIDIDENIINNMDQLPGYMMRKYKGKEEFEEIHFKVQ